MTPIPLIILSDEEKQQLMVLAETAPEEIIHRARLIMAYAEGKPTIQAATAAKISRGRARYWKRQFLANRMDIFKSEAQRLPHEKALDEKANIEVTRVEEELVKGGGAGEVKRETEIQFVEPRDKIGIAVTDSLAEAGKKVWSYYFAIMLLHESGTVQGEDIEELHDMRVATRRMRSAFDVFGSAFDTKTMQRYLKGLRKIGRVLGRVRDMDVILENAVKYQNRLDKTLQSGLEALMISWQHTIDQQRLKMIKYLNSEDYHNFNTSFNRFLQMNRTNISQEFKIDGTNPLVRDSVPALVYSRYAAVRAYESIISIATIDQLHALRIEFKKFRYTLEYFKEVLGKNISNAINEIKDMQDHLGELHDADVACGLVGKFLTEWERSQLTVPVSQRQSTEPMVTYLAYLHSERYRLVQTFPARWMKFNQPEFRHIIAEAIALL
jgi:CHAD domain-containing protein